MSQENVKQQYRAADAFSRHDLDAFLAICDPEIELVSATWSWMAAVTSAATPPSGAGGRRCSASTPTSPLRSRRYAISET